MSQIHKLGKRVQIHKHTTNKSEDLRYLCFNSQSFKFQISYRIIQASMFYIYSSSPYEYSTYTPSTAGKVCLTFHKTHVCILFRTPLPSLPYCHQIYCRCTRNLYDLLHISIIFRSHGARHLARYLKYRVNHKKCICCSDALFPHSIAPIRFRCQVCNTICCFRHPYLMLS